ncbi:hypothetical protein HNR46_001071 [Haloferula luteola]|uniref:VanZ like family protein n=1 Tax=Haloferula luteola TaxID=595692 RepID=A0A840UXF0_9BACT|nr:VanZ family protein [Haloferula luteola]MBB5350837.1 hypothetical protein [Haloferula luteola]
MDFSKICSSVHGEGGARFWKVLAWSVGVAFILVLFFFSWIPDPALNRIRWLSGLGAWADRHDQLRTAVPLVFVGVAVGAFLVAGKKGWKAWLIALLVLRELVMLAEFGQLFLPKRHCDPVDVVYGTCGAGVGLALAWVAGRIRKGWRKRGLSSASQAVDGAVVSQE